MEKDLNYWAVGCYTSQIRIKQKHRELEGELCVTEKCFPRRRCGDCLFIRMRS